MCFFCYLGMWSLITVTLFSVIIVHGQPFRDALDETEELRDMLRQSVEQNRKLEKQTNRMKLIWSGLSQMCQVLAQQECPCEYSLANSSKETKYKQETSLRILSVKTSGNQSNTVRLTVTYTALDNHLTDWITIYHKYGARGQYRTGGERTSLGAAKFSSSVQLTHVDYITTVIVQVYSGAETASVTFDTKNMVQKNEQILPAYKSSLIRMNYTYKAPKDGNMNVSIAEKELSTKEIEGLVIFFSGYNASSNPHKLYEVNVFSDNEITVPDYDRTSGNPTLKVTLHESLLDWGGILTIRVPQPEVYEKRSRDNLVESFLLGYSIFILPSDSDDIVPSNAVVLHALESDTVITPVASLMWFVMGNPTPDIQIYRVLKNGRRKKLKIESLDFDANTRVVAYTLRTDDRKVAGTYICRATSGTRVVEDIRDIGVYKPVKFDDAKTGVMKNNTNKVVFGCKVTWTIKPVLEFRQYDAMGPVVQQDGRYKIYEVQTGKRSSQITLSVSPPDENLHPLLCVARVDAIEEYKKIELFPGVDMDNVYDYFNATSVNFPTFP